MKNTKISVLAGFMFILLITAVTFVIAQPKEEYKILQTQEGLDYTPNRVIADSGYDYTYLFSPDIDMVNNMSIFYSHDLASIELLGWLSSYELHTAISTDLLIICNTQDNITNNCYEFEVLSNIYIPHLDQDRWLKIFSTNNYTEYNSDTDVDEFYSENRE